jgi:hypothetical protein
MNEIGHNGVQRKLLLFLHLEVTLDNFIRQVRFSLNPVSHFLLLDELGYLGADCLEIA